MIIKIHHKGLEKFYFTGNTADIHASHASSLRLLLLVLDSAQTPQDFILPTAHLKTVADTTYQLITTDYIIDFTYTSSQLIITDYQPL